MDLTRKIRLYPNKTMLAVLDSLCNYRRFCWNQALDVWQTLYRQRQEHLPSDLRLKVKQSVKDKSISFTNNEKTLLAQYPSPTYYTINGIMTSLKQDWQYQLSSRVSYLTVKDLAKAWKSFFDNMKDSTSHAGKPGFKSKKNSKQGFKTDRAQIKNGKLHLDKARAYKDAWYGISFNGYNLPDCKIKHCAITKINNKYYASLVIDIPVEQLPKTGKKTAIDANVNHFDYTDGSFAVCPKQLDVLYGQIKHYQRILARKRKVNGKKATQSNQYFKARTKLQRCYERVANIQNDLLHKFTTEIYHNYDAVVIEDLNVKAMQMSKKAKNLHRSLFGKFRLQMEYKSKNFDKALIVAKRYYPSTQRCSNCGHVKTGDDKITLNGNAKHGTKHNEYVCYECGFEADRDKNAVLNLLALAN